MMEKFTKPELFNFLCADIPVEGEPDDIVDGDLGNSVEL